MQVAFGRVRRKSRITRITRITRILRGFLLVRGVTCLKQDFQDFSNERSVVRTGIY